MANRGINASNEVKIKQRWMEKESIQMKGAYAKALKNEHNQELMEIVEMDELYFCVKKKT